MTENNTSVVKAQETKSGNLYSVVLRDTRNT